jgi:hypothetical protein
MYAEQNYQRDEPHDNPVAPVVSEIKVDDTIHVSARLYAEFGSKHNPEHGKHLQEK